MRTLSVSSRAVLGLSVCCAVVLAHAQGFPAKPITFVNQQVAGGPSDVTMRLIGHKMAESMHQPVLVESRPGGGGAVGAVYVMQAPPDGYTLFVANVASHAVNKTLNAKLPYDPVKDFAPVTLIWNYPSLLGIWANNPAKTVADLVAMAKKAPNALSYASQGYGSSGHLGGALLSAAAGQPMVHVPYKGGPEAIADLLAGRVDIFIASYASLGPVHKAGKVRILAAAAEKRHYLLPDVPTMAELGFPEISFDGWFGVVAPAKTAPAIVQRLRDELVRAVQHPEVAKNMAEQGIVPLVSASPEEFGSFISSEISRLGRAVKLSGAKLE